MTQNIYDDAQFFSIYSQLPRSVDGLDGAPEWPALRARIPELSGSRILDLGCGFGWFARWAAAAGAASVLGVDVSERMLARAEADTHDSQITYVCEDLETFAPAPAGFDMAYSSLALHYVADLAGLLVRLHAGLVLGASFVFSVEHPIYTAPSSPEWAHAGPDHTVWPLDDYLVEGPRTTDWLTPGVRKQHRTIATYLTLLRSTGFTLTDLAEWGPTDEQLIENPDWEHERHRPLFLLVAARRD